MVKKFFVVAGVLVFLAIGGAVVNNVFFGPSDEELILETLTEATEAAAEGEASPVLDALSRNFEYGDDSPIKFDVAKVIREAKPDMIILDPNPKIEGDVAVVESDIQLSMSFMGAGIQQTIPDVVIELKKETSFASLLPKPKWRVTKVTAENLPYSY